MKIEMISTSDASTKEFAEELFSEFNTDNRQISINLTISENFANEIFQAGIAFAIVLGGVFLDKSIEKIIDYIVETVKDKIKKKEKYDVNITINIHLENKTLNNQYNLLTDIEKLKEDLKDAGKY